MQRRLNCSLAGGLPLSDCPSLQVLAHAAAVVRPLKPQFYKVFMDLFSVRRCLRDLAASVLMSAESWNAYVDGAGGAPLSVGIMKL